MDYTIKLNAVNKSEKNVKAFAEVTLGDCFKITNIAVVEGKENRLFVSMPSFRSKERDEYNQAVYRDVCNPITKEFREELYEDILEVYEEMKDLGKAELVKKGVGMQEPEFAVKVTPFEREGSNILGLASIYFEDSFVVGNVSILRGKESEFVAMPSYRTKQVGKNGKPKYQDVCFPVTKEFREKLYQEIIDCYRLGKEKTMDGSKKQATSKNAAKAREKKNPSSSR